MRVPFVSDSAPGEPTTECIFHPGSKEVLMQELPGFPQPMVNSLERNSPVRVGEAPGKGLGVFASRVIEAGELIFSERPLLVAAQWLPTSSLDQFEDILAVGVKQIGDEDKAAYMALMNSHLEDGSGPLTGIFRTNGLGIKGLRPDLKGVTAMCTGVCDTISRINHRRSGMSPRFRSIFAVRDLAADDELTHQYIPIDGSTAERNELLKPYDFVCTCRACKDPESDARRADLKQSNSKPASPSWLSDPPGSEALIFEECRRQVEIIEREGMESMSRYWDVLSAGMAVCVVMSDAQSASEWARKLMTIGWVDMNQEVMELFVDAQSPEYQAHPMWGARLKIGTGKSEEDVLKDVMKDMVAQFEALGVHCYSFD
ncbi:SET domain-containing protein [Roridomyces roridus]|uniref:SET domain-containing protein n=1 Tax=Roridomyces roridus TaxID=1738132 RepID=A0AAD7C770_9AGAR|nr:SET domain-containing protein [Roridomyces roridus]